MSLTDKIQVQGCAIVGTGCPIKVEVEDDQVSFDFGDHLDLTLVLQNEHAVARFSDAWDSAVEQVNAWRIETGRVRTEHKPQP